MTDSGPTTDGLEHLAREHDARLAGLRNPGEFLETVGIALVSLREERFKEEAGPDGDPWAPLAESTAMKIVRRFSGATQKTLGMKAGPERGLLYEELHIYFHAKRRGDAGALEALRKSLGISESRSKRLAAERRGHEHILQDTGRMAGSLSYQVDEGALSVTVTLGVDYAEYHQFGTQNMPARPILGFDDRDRRRIEDIKADWIARVMGGEG